MQAILLAGGFGTRLKPIIGDAIPKPMAIIDGEPFLVHYIRSLAMQGIAEVMLTLHHQAHIIQEYFKEQFEGVRIRYSVEPTPLGTGGAIKHALTLLNPIAPAFVSNADSVMNLDIKAMMRAHYAADTLLTVALTMLENCSQGGQAWVDDKGMMTAFQYPGREEAGFVSMGAYIVAPEIFTTFDMPEVFSFETDFKQPHMHLLKPQAFICDGHFLDIGTPERYQRACLLNETA